MTRTTVVFGGPSPEHDVSILTGLQAARVLERAGLEVQALYWTPSRDWYRVAPTLEAADFLEGVPRGAQRLELIVEGSEAGFRRPRRLGGGARVDVGVLLNCCHGGPGEDGRLQGLLEIAGIPFTGCGAAASALGIDKLAFHGAVTAAGLPSLPRVALGADFDDPRFDGPYLVKPRFGGSSIGIEAVDDVDTARALARTSPHLRGGAVLEPYRPSVVDLNIGIRTHPALELSAIERPLREGSSSIYSYAEKYLHGGPEGGMQSAPRELPAELPGEVAERIRECARAVAELVPLRGICRLDFLYEDRELWVNEVNTIPGALALYLWVEPRLDYAQLLLDLVAEAERGPPRLDSAGADGTALRSAGRIASKLA